MVSTFALYFSGVALTNMEAFLVLIMWSSRMILIAVKYAYLDIHELNTFHSEASTSRSIQLLVSHLLAKWASPDWLTILREINFSSQRANLKGSQSWFTRNKGLRLPVTFIGPARCRRVLDLLDTACWDVLPDDDSDKHETKLWNCPRAKGKFGSIKGIPAGYSSRNSALEASDLLRLDVPTGLLLSAIIYKQVRESKKAGVVSGIHRCTVLLAVLLCLMPLIVRMSVPRLPPYSVLAGLNTSMSAANANSMALEWRCAHLLGGSSVEWGSGDSVCRFGHIWGYISYIGAFAFNGFTMFFFLFVSVIDYRRRASVLESLRKLLRPSVKSVGDDRLEKAKEDENFFENHADEDEAKYGFIEKLLQLQSEQITKTGETKEGPAEDDDSTQAARRRPRRHSTFTSTATLSDAAPLGRCSYERQHNLNGHDEGGGALLWQRLSDAHTIHALLRSNQHCDPPSKCARLTIHELHAHGGCGRR